MNNIVKKTIENLKRNHFEVYYTSNINEARKVFQEEIYCNLNPCSVSYGDSETFFSTGLRAWLKSNTRHEYIDTFEEGIKFKEKINRMRAALTVDLFITGSNAITSNGQIINLDMIGNRIGGINFGPKYVVLFVETKKIHNDLESAMSHVRNFIAPANAKRHSDINTPCKTKGKCCDCNSPTRICNQWLITEKSLPEKRIKIILIDS